MCGIAGIVSPGKGWDLEACMARMLSSITHRGPDGQGLHIDEGVALGHRRLAIIDLTQDGAQPMLNADGDLVLVFNGEIYNYIELRRDLEARGRRFQSRSDTEVLLQAYDEWGEGCVSRLNGMWSFAILDKRRNLVFCSRDRYGEKPFYFAHHDGAFCFASEIRQLLTLLPHRAANRDLLNRFLIGITGEGIECSFFRDVAKLPAGHNLVHHIDRRKTEITRYFDLTTDEDVATAGFEENLERFRHLFDQAVGIRMRSDVTVGTCLSGGLDSSSIAALASGMVTGGTGGRFSAITAGSTETGNDEQHFAEMVAGHLGLNWITTRPTYDDFVACMEDVVAAQEEPFGSASIVMQYQVMRAAAANGVKVLLDGQGGDEVFMGYERYFVAHLRHVLGQGHLWKAISDLRAMNRNNALMDISTFAKYLVYFSSPHIRSRRIRNRSWFLRDRPKRIEGVHSYSAAMASPFDLQKFELETSNLPPLLRFEDKNAMWHSIETRLPMLDPDLVRFACSLPIDQKMHDGWSKFILRRGAESRLPEAICWRRDKIGFEAPQASWIGRHREDMMAAIRRSAILDEMVDLKRLEESNFAIDDASFWRLYVAARWERTFSVHDLV
ncbi:MAG: asparagine synthase (glutamine-hydrolyzing) [Candidatus Puniceispirillaceae bacterium]